MDRSMSTLSLNTEAAHNGDSAPSNLPSSTFRLKHPLVWIDLEMTGLEIENDRILEIACIITDGKLDTMVKGPDLIINQPEECLQNMSEWSQQHHTASGLVEEVRKSKVTEKEAEKELKSASNSLLIFAGSYQDKRACCPNQMHNTPSNNSSHWVLELVLKHCPPDFRNPGRVQAQLAGNSVYTDFLFLKKYMPRLAEVFPHIIVDVSSIRALCYRWSPQVHHRAPAKKKSHRAFEDIRESITELRYLQKAFFRDFGARVRPDLSGHPN